MSFSQALREAAGAALRGKVTLNADMKPLSWFRCGGPADLLFEPEDEADLAAFLTALPADVPLLVVGLGSNLLVRDGGFKGAVVRLTRGFAGITVNDLTVQAGAGAADVKVARAAAEAGIAGFTFLRGIPGTIGGALRMNGGAYGGETKDILREAYAVTRAGERVTLTNAQMGFSYRHCAAPDDLIFTGALFEGSAGERAALLAEMDQITQARSSSQPVNTRTGGSTFKNPDGMKAWELIDKAGCRGLSRGAAQVSELHCNFLINHGGASAADIEGLGEEVRRRVKETSGVDLHWEIKRVGDA